MADETKHETSTAQTGPASAQGAHTSASSQAQSNTQQAPLCKTCKNPLEVYEGTNPDKVGTGFCTVCGERTPLKK